MPMTGVVDTDNARIDLFVDWSTETGAQTVGTVVRRVGHVNAPDEYVRGLFGSTLLGEQAYVSDHEAPLDAQIWYVATADNMAGPLVAGPFTIPSAGAVWLKDPGRPWADLELDLCVNPSKSEAECPPSFIVQDTFSRTVVDGWGSADTGQAWTNTGTAADFDVAAGVGTHAHPVVNSAHRSSITATTADQEVVVTIAPSVLAVGDSLFAGPVLRNLDTNNYYWARGTWTTTGTVQMALRKRVAGTETGVGAVATLPFGYVAGQQFKIRFRVQGSELRIRVWPASVAESENWDIVEHDTSLTLAGSVGVRSLVGSASTAVNPVFSFDDFSYVDPSAVQPINLAWVGFRDKSRAMDAGLFPVLDDERPSDVFARRKDITTEIRFLSRSLSTITSVYELFTAGGPILVQVPTEYGMNAPYGQRDRYYQPEDLREAYLSQDQRKVYRLWSAPAVSVDSPIGEPQGTDTTNWCALQDSYPTFAHLTATGLTWGQIAAGDAL